MMFLLALVARLGVPQQFQRFVVIAALVTLAIGVLGVAKCSYDASIITTHDARADAASATADRKADGAAAVTRRADDARLSQERTQIERAEANAKTPDDARVARLRCIRLQQDARSANREPPACSRPVVPDRAASAD